MFNWSPDHGAAAPVFASAANAFKMAGELERARETFVLAAEHHDKVNPNPNPNPDPDCDPDCDPAPNPNPKP